MVSRPSQAVGLQSATVIMSPDHVRSELIEWQEDSIHNRANSKAKPATLKDGMSIWLVVIVLYSSYV